MKIIDSTLTCSFVTPERVGPSSSQSVVDWFFRAMLRTCLPPFTFHVPMHTRSFSDVVKSPQRSQTAFLNGTGAATTKWEGTIKNGHMYKVMWLDHCYGNQFAMWLSELIGKKSWNGNWECNCQSKGRSIGRGVRVWLNSLLEGPS